MTWGTFGFLQSLNTRLSGLSLFLCIFEGWRQGQGWFIHGSQLAERGRQCKHLGLHPRWAGGETITNSNTKESLLWAGPRLVLQEVLLIPTL